MIKLIKRLENGMLKIGKKFYREVSEDEIVDISLGKARYSVCTIWRHGSGSKINTLCIVSAVTREEAIQLAEEQNSALSFSGYKKISELVAKDDK